MSIENATDSPSLTKSGKPRKQRQIGADGKPLHRMILVVSDTNYKRILEVVADNTGSEFAKNFVFENDIEVKQRFLGNAISDICDSYFGNKNQG